MGASIDLPARLEHRRGLDARQAKVLGAFFLIYFVWGSNFLAIRYAIETIPPFLLMGIRSLLAGLCLYLWAILSSDERPTLAHWRAAAVVGVLLFLGCHGLLAWAQQRVPSGVAALAMATLPLWMTLLDWLWAGARRPGLPVWLGLLLGLVGLAVLVGPGSWGGAVDVIGLVAIQVSGFAWALGSVQARRSHLPSSVVLSTGMQLIAGGAALTVVSLVSGEALTFTGAVSMRSLLGFPTWGRSLDPGVHRLRLAVAGVDAVASGQLRLRQPAGGRRGRLDGGRRAARRANGAGRSPHPRSRGLDLEREATVT